jgi:methyl-accepting chemotaxis protein
MKLVALAACVASLVFVVSSCGGGDRTSAAEWAESFCTATRDWSNEIERITEDIPDLSGLSIETLDDAAGEARETTDAYVEELRALGAPDIESSEQLESSIERLADEVESEAEEIEDTVEDASGVTGLATAGRDISSSVAAMFTALARTSEAIENADVDGELEQAFEDTEACDQIGS